METQKFTSSYGDNLTITNSELVVTNKFGNTYKGWLNENGKVVTKSKMGLGYLVRAYREFNDTAWAVCI